jgi:hypothetical protein
MHVCETGSRAAVVPSNPRILFLAPRKGGAIPGGHLTGEVCFADRREAFHKTGDDAASAWRRECLFLKASQRLQTRIPGA